MAIYLSVKQVFNKRYNVQDPFCVRFVKMTTSDCTLYYFAICFVFTF